MDTNMHTMPTLFEQLGLPSQEEDIESFLAQHKLQNNNIHLAQADFWSPAQRDFLEESLVEDSVWAEVVDQLDVLLRS
jgi:Protein of unknown function (DUF2789)